jgi:hypothetical protein
MMLMLHKFMKTITRKQLQAYGLSKYQVGILTKTLTPTGKERRSATFALAEIIDAIRERLKAPRLKQSTCAVFSSTMHQLTERLGNVVEIPFNPSSSPELQKAGTQLIQAISRTDAALANLKADAAEIHEKYKVAQ